MSQVAIDQLFTRKLGSGDGECYRCGQSLSTMKPSTRALKQFARMTGRAFPRLGVSLNVAADSETLGATKQVMGRGMFCCDCAVAYMTEFNRLNRELRAN